MTLQDTIPQDTTPRKRRRKAAGESAPVTATLLAHPAVDRILESATRAAEELTRLNAAMDKLMVATSDGVIPAVRVLADRLISFLDAAAGWDEREPDGDEQDDDGDCTEATLGAPEAVMNQERAWRDNSQEGEDREGDELDRGEISDLEHSGESDSDRMGATVDDEPSLGSLDGRMSQVRWGLPDRDQIGAAFDREYDDADHAC